MLKIENFTNWFKNLALELKSLYIISKGAS